MTPKRFVTLIAVMMVLCSATVIGTDTAPVGLNKMIRFVVTCLLGFSLVKGWIWARWIAIILVGLSGIALVLGGVVLLISPVPFSGLLLLAVGLVQVVCVLGLLTPTAKAHFA